MLVYYPFYEEMGVFGNNFESIQKSTVIKRPGHIVGIYIRPFLPSGGYSYTQNMEIAVKDIGATGEYILDTTTVCIFAAGDVDFSLYSGTNPNWFNPIFIPLDHIIEKNHQLNVEIKNMTNAPVDVYGVFLYQK